MELNLNPKFEHYGRFKRRLFLLIAPKAYFCLLLLAALSPLTSRENLDLTIEQSPFIIHCVSVDSLYATQAGAILSKAFEEIAFDLSVESSRPFRVYIMPTRKSFRDALKGTLPSWTGAFAVPDQHLMVIKSPRWDKSDNYEQVLIHELVHLVVHNFIGVYDLPRWIDEGMAIFYSGEDRWKTDMAVSKALTTGSILPLSEIDDVLEYHRAKADLAYQQSFSAVNYLLATYDIEALHEIIYSLKDGVNIQKAFLNATGSNLDDFENEWKTYIKKAHRWFWFYEINEYIWAFILVIAAFAFVLRHVRNKRIEREWRNESFNPIENDPEED